MLKIPADPTRFANYEDLIDLEAEMQLPMIVDAEMGMPLELGRNDDAYWIGDDKLVNPQQPAEELDAEDLALLAPPATGKTIGPGGSIITAKSKESVTWLRRTEYISHERKPLAPTQSREPARKVEVVPISNASRSDIVLKTFADANAPLEDIRHPTKRGLKAVASYAVLPDTRAADVSYSLMRFAEDPNELRVTETGQMQQGADGSRVAFGLVRPLQSKQEGEGLRLGLYLPQASDVEALSEERGRAHDAKPAERAYEYSFTRDYDEVRVNRAAINEFVFAFSDGTPIMASNGMDVDNAPTAEPSGAFYVPIRATRALRKLRVKTDAAHYGDSARERGFEFWHGITITHLGTADASVLQAEAPEDEPVKDE